MKKTKYVQKKDRMKNEKKKSPTQRREDQKNEEKKKWKRPYKKTKVKCKNEKKYQKHRANYKEEVVTLSQMNILPFPKTTLQANDKSYLISFFMFSY